MKTAPAPRVRPARAKPGDRPTTVARVPSGVGAVRRIATHPAVVAWVVARVAVFGALGLARFAVSNLGAESQTGRPPSGLLGWDAAWYLRIINTGYGHLPWEARRFFPLLPMLAKPVALFTGSRVAVLVIVNAAALLAGVLLERLVRQETGDAALAGRATWYLAVLPPAFVLSMGYAEALMIAGSIAVFLALRNKRWWWAAAAGAIVGVSRPLGVLLIVPCAIEAVPAIMRVATRERIARLAATIGPVAGAAAYLGWVGLRFGDPLFPFKVQEEIGRRGHLASPIGRLVHAGSDLANGSAFGSGLHLPWALAFIALIALAARRLPASYTAFAALIIVIALSAGNLDSLERYGLSAFPVVIGVAVATRSAIVERAVLVLCACGFVAYATLTFLGAYVP